MVCRLTSFFRKRRIDWKNGKSVIARELQALMSETIVIDSKINLDGKHVPLSEAQKVRLIETLESEKKLIKIYDARPITGFNDAYFGHFYSLECNSE